MKDAVCAFLGLIGSLLALFVGGVDTMLIVLFLVLSIDYITGLLVAIVFKASPKTTTGAANSAIGLKGICKKFAMLLMVGVANSLDMVLGSSFCRAGLIVSFTANETLSILENAGLMGIPIPKVMKDAIDILNKKEDQK